MSIKDCHAILVLVFYAVKMVLWLPAIMLRPTWHLLNDYFCSMCRLLPHFDQVAPPGANLSNIVFTVNNVARVLRKLKTHSSCGPDGFPLSY